MYGVLPALTLGSLGKARGFVAGDMFVGGLFEGRAGEEHAVGVGKLGGRAASQLDLLRDEVRPLRRQVAPQATDGRVQRRSLAANSMSMTAASSPVSQS